PLPQTPTHFPYTTLFRSPVHPRSGNKTLCCSPCEDILDKGRGSAVYLESRDVLENRKRTHFGDQAVRDGFAGTELVVCAFDSLRSEEHTSELQSPDHLVC